MSRSGKNGAATGSLLRLAACAALLSCRPLCPARADDLQRRGAARGCVRDHHRRCRAPGGYQGKGLSGPVPVLSEQRKFDPALADADAALQLDAKSVPALQWRGGLRAELRKYPEPISDLNEAIALRQDFAVAVVARGRVYSETGELDKAFADLNAAIAINVNVANA
jgi:tetratricopeptide (TPR) repeat protein